jgi:hypothetical protein
MTTNQGRQAPDKDDQTSRFIADCDRIEAEELAMRDQAPDKAGERKGVEFDSQNPQHWVEKYRDEFIKRLDAEARLAALAPSAPIAAPVRDVGDARGVANVMEALWRDAEDESERLRAGFWPSDLAIAEAFHEHRRETQPSLPPWSEVLEGSGIWQISHNFATRLSSLRPAPAGDVPGEAQTQEAWQPIADLKPQTNAVLGRWARSGDNEDGSEFWYWQEATGRWFEHAGEVHWCLRSGRFDHGPFYGEAPTHFHVIPEKPARVEAQTQEGGR